MKICILRLSECVIFIIFIFVPPCVPQGRRYDIEEEAQKLYNVDLKTVIARFRRSPEYLRILRNQVNEMYQELELKETYLFLAQKEIIQKRVKDVLSMENSTASVDCITQETAAGEPQPVKGEPGEPGPSEALQGEEGAPAEEAPGRRNALRYYRRRHQLTTKPGYGVTLLDNYPKFSDAIQVTERNKLRDIGYEEAGNLIHKTISAMDEDPEATTGGQAAGTDAAEAGAGAQAVADADAETHEAVHTVGTVASTTLLPPEETSPTEAAPVAAAGEVTPEGEPSPAEGQAVSEPPEINVEMPPDKPEEGTAQVPPANARTRKGTEKTTKPTTTKRGQKTTTTKAKKTTTTTTKKKEKTTTKKPTTTKLTTTKKGQKTTTKKATTVKNKGRREFTNTLNTRLDFFDYLNNF